MPLYDRICRCGWTAIDVWEPIAAPTHACPDCGHLTERAWLTKTTTVIGDECDFVQHNGTPVPIRFRSKAEFARWKKEHGYTNVDTHIGKPGSDKSPFTTNWAASYDPYTAANVKELLERAFQQTPTTTAPDVFHVDWYDPLTGQPSNARQTVVQDA
jgi:hypothetical protein